MGLSSEPLAAALKAVKYKVSVMEANGASDTYLAHSTFLIRTRTQPHSCTHAHAETHCRPGGITVQRGGSAAAVRPNNTRSP